MPFWSQSETLCIAIKVAMPFGNEGLNLSDHSSAPPFQKICLLLSVIGLYTLWPGCSDPLLAQAQSPGFGVSARLTGMKVSVTSKAAYSSDREGTTANSSAHEETLCVYA